MKDKLKIALIGLGHRGMGVFEYEILKLDDIIIAGVCDSYEDRTNAAAELTQKVKGYTPVKSTDYRDMLNLDIDAVVITCAWEDHIRIAVEALKKGIYVGTEVAGAFSLDDCWRLVRASEESGTPCMMLENCCYGKRELMLLNMVKSGFFGKVVHCTGMYGHYLADEILNGVKNRHYRLRNYIGRNCENYPTHELVPIGKLLDINNGNRFLTLTSVASASYGLEAVVKDNEEFKDLKDTRFAQGDVVTTTIKCANGETVTITLDTTLPRYYSRGLTVHGTKATYIEDNDSLYEYPKHKQFTDPPHSKEIWGNMAEYEKDYIHPLWEGSSSGGGHGGMDPKCYRAFFDAAKAGINPPIDVYDTATYMAVSVLSEQSIALGGAPVYFPDFTNGRYLNRKDIVEYPYMLHKVEKK